MTVRGRDARPAASEKTIVEWPSEKKKPTPSGRLPCCEQLARGVVDRRDVVGVEGVAEAERVGEHAEPGQRRIAARVEEEQTPAGDVQRCEPRLRSRDEAQPFLVRQLSG